MKPEPPRRQGSTARWILLLVFGCALLSPDPSSHARPSPEKYLADGKACHENLLASPKRKKYRDNWEKCITNFKNILTRYPKSPVAEDARLGLGELYSGLYHYSKNPRDLERSLEYYHQVISADPMSASARAAQYRISHIDDARTGPSLTTIQGLRHWVYSDYTRLVLDLDHEAEVQREDSDGNTVQIRLDRTRLGPAAEEGRSDLAEGLLQRISVQQADPDSVRLRIDVKGLDNQPKIIFLNNPDRLVIDLFGTNSTAAAEATPTKSVGDGSAYAQALPVGIRTIVIDPGHGGKDPGAIGRTGLTEKDIVLDIGLRLRNLIQNRLNRKIIMTRDDDTFVSLDDRTLLANSKNADLFVSIHVNSHPRRSTRGVEVYYLGQASDHNARALAARENNVSIQSMDNLDRSVKQILFDLGREYKIDQSQTLAHLARQSFRTVLDNRYDYDVVDHGVKRAPFYVLLNSNMPSILAEVSFISNPSEEKLLGRKEYRQAIAESLFQAIRAYIATIEPTS